MAISIIIFVAGFIIGGFVVTVYFGESASDTGRILLLEQRADWAQRAFQAYSQENPQVAIWALENQADVYNKYYEQAERIGNDKAFFSQVDLVITYVRLAIAYQAAKDKQKYDQNISKALSLAKQICPDTLCTEEELLDFVKKLDDIAIKGTKQ